MPKILVADDEKALRLLVAGTLEMGEYHCILEADNGESALALATKEKPDLVILDVMMPRMTGYEVCRSIKTHPDLRQTKVIILTARAQELDRTAATKALADYYITKPFSPRELLATVQALLKEA